MPDDLTKYVDSVTIITAEMFNTFYGGLFGTDEGDLLEPTDPLVGGHSHDGQHIDGHAQKINLVEHVTGKLRHVNLADEAVRKRNIQAFRDRDRAIPEFEVIDGESFYYLNLDAASSLGLLVLTDDGRVVVDSSGEVVIKKAS